MDNLVILEEGEYDFIPDDNDAEVTLFWIKETLDL